MRTIFLTVDFIVAELAVVDVSVRIPVIFVKKIVVKKRISTHGDRTDRSSTGRPFR